jgi:hypothetical protein
MRSSVLVMLAAVLAGMPLLDASSAPSSRDRALPSTLFDQRRALAILSEIAGDDFEGRKSGLPGGVRTEEYVAAHFKACGLEPAGENGTYFLPFPMLSTEERGAKMELLDSPYGKVPFLYGEDFSLITNSGSGDITAEVVVAGHGLCDPARRWDDYGDTDVSGRIVLIVRGAPENGYNWDMDTSRDSTLHEAVRRGAAAVLYLQEARPVHGGAVHEGSYFPEVPVAYIGHRAADLLFLNTGLEREAYEKGLASAPHPFATGKRFHFAADVRRIPGGSARNVVGSIAGTDRRLRDEIIIVGGHMDHIGVDGRGLVFNGADDNGSGTAVVVELARSFAAGPRAPRRTVVFATFAGEEQGLLGAEALAKNPPFDLRRAVAMINLDMAGHGEGKTGLGGGERHPEIMRAFRALLDSTLAESLGVHHAWGGEGSDHAPFRRAGIPTYNFWTEGEHRFYHRLDDDVAWIDSIALGCEGRMSERWIRFLADWPEPLAREHAAGRALLYESCQIDFDGAPQRSLPHYAAGSVRWFDAGLFGSEGFLDELDRLTGKAGGDSLALVNKLAGVRGDAWQGKRVQLIGLDRAAGLPARRMGLLSDLHVSLVRGAGAGAAAGFAGEAVTFLSPPDTALIPALPEDAKACLRVFANRGEEIREPDVFPRKQFFFIVSLDGPMEPAELARALREMGWDRVHLDLMPWIERAGEEPACVFLEDLQAAGPFEQRRLRAMLGGNLERM